MTEQKNDILKGRAWIELDMSALRHNIEEVKKILPKDCRIMAAVKANAYGHGAVLISKELNRSGVKSFCVACLDEGIELRRSGIEGEILVLGYTHPCCLPLLNKYRLTQSVIDYEYALLLNSCGQKLNVHLAIDTGMHRLGERSDNIDRILKIFSCENLIVSGIYTHLCASDGKSDKDIQYTVKQANAFNDVLRQIKSRGFICPKTHLQASCGVLNYPKLSGDYARIGIALYGVLSKREFDGTDMLRPVLSVKARVLCVKDLFKGESAGYGLQYTARKNSKIAVISIGYADGYPRSLSCGVGSVLISGSRAAVIGRICMDQTIVDVSDIHNVKAGDTAIIIGSSGDAEITAYDIAEKTNTITNEVLSRLSTRLERIVAANDNKI